MDMTSREACLLIISLLLLIMISPEAVHSQILLNDKESVQITGDVRSGYIGFIGRERNGARLSQHEFRNRTRIGLDVRLTNQLSFHSRYAVRVSSLDFHLYPGLNTTSTGNNGLKMGEGAFDQFYASVQMSDWLRLKAGRFQTSFTLDGIIKNSILRQDSPNTDIGWTDGLQLTATTLSGWKTDLIMQSHLLNRPSNVFRYPLEPDHTHIPFTFFSSIKKGFKAGALSSLSLNVTYSPDMLLINSEGHRKSYIAASIKPQFKKLFNSGRQLLWGTEIAYSFNRPERTVFGFDESPNSSSGGFGFQTVLSVIDLFKNQHVGLMAAALEPSLLTSSAFWNNLMLFEIRYSTTWSSNVSTDIRLRYRSDLEKPGGDLNKRRQVYPFARITYKL
jgi:hypothetical protein